MPSNFIPILITNKFVPVRFHFSSILQVMTFACCEYAANICIYMFSVSDTVEWLVYLNRNSKQIGSKPQLSNELKMNWFDSVSLPFRGKIYLTFNPNTRKKTNHIFSWLPVLYPTSLLSNNIFSPHRSKMSQVRFLMIQKSYQFCSLNVFV